MTTDRLKDLSIVCLIVCFFAALTLGFGLHDGRVIALGMGCLLVAYLATKG